MHKTYKISGTIIRDNEEKSLEGKICFSRTGTIKEGSLTISNSYYTNANFYGELLNQNQDEKLRLVISLPQEFIYISYVSLNGASKKNPCGEYIGTWKSYSGNNLGDFKHIFNGENANITTKLKIETIENK